MKIRKLCDDIVDALEADPVQTVRHLEEFEVGDCWQKLFLCENGENIQDASRLTRYMQSLENYGLNQGEAKFGHKMPVPKKEDTTRILQIYRTR